MNVEFEIFILNLMKIMKVDMRTKMIEKIKNIRIFMFYVLIFNKDSLNIKKKMYIFILLLLENFNIAA
jgi:hypothetical protein